MKPLFLTFLLLLVTTLASAINISGRVTDEQFEPVAGADVKEMDALDRIVSQTRTDENGFFTLQIRNQNNRIQVYKDGYERHQQAMEGKKVFKITLKEKYQTAQGEAKVTRRKTMQTNRLIVGIVNNRYEPFQTWFDQYNDTIVEVVVPVQAMSMVDEYPTGRALYFLNATERVIERGFTIDDEHPVSGDPNEVDTPFWQRMQRGDASTAINDGKGELCYFYPKFHFTIAQLQHLVEVADQIIYITAENSSATNSWKFYPSKKFAKELTKYLTKLKGK